MQQVTARACSLSGRAVPATANHPQAAGARRHTSTGAASRPPRAGTRDRLRTQRSRLRGRVAGSASRSRGLLRRRTIGKEHSAAGREARGVAGGAAGAAPALALGPAHPRLPAQMPGPAAGLPAPGPPRLLVRTRGRQMRSAWLSTQAQEHARDSAHRPGDRLKCWGCCAVHALPALQLFGRLRFTLAPCSGARRLLGCLRSGDLVAALGREAAALPAAAATLAPASAML